MTQNRRIILNIVATYGRSLLSMACGLFTSRWVLMALGREDFGLYGVVGGMTVFITFINGLLSGANSRMYAISVGKAQVLEDKSRGLEECRRWFNTAVMIHSIIPFLLVVVGYPIGAYAITHWLVIPVDRLDVCVWVFRFVCISCFIGMLNVPFSAMYIAKQNIAELTVYSVGQTVVSFVFVYFMVSHPGDWLLRYAAWMCAIAVAPQIIICLRAFKAFKECRVNFSYWWDIARVRQLGGFAWWQAFGGLGNMCCGQGMAILVNRFFGASGNAAMSIANQVNGQTQTLAAAMQGAFSPAITTAYGSGNMALMKSMALRTCKFGVLLVLLFVLPLSLELSEVMHLWLKEPPPYSAGLCWFMMISLLVDKSSVGHMIVVNASGKIAAYQFFLGSMMIMTLPFAWVLVKCGLGIYAIGYAFIIMRIVCSFGRVVFARKIVGMEMRRWLIGIVLPVTLVSVATMAVGALFVYALRPGLGRIVLTTCICEVIFLPLIWLFVLDFDERHFVLSKLKRFVLK